MLHQVDVEVNGVAEHCQQVGQLAGLVQPCRPGNLGIVYPGQLELKLETKFPLTPMGVLAPGSAHARPFPRPLIKMSGNLLAHMSAKSP